MSKNDIGDDKDYEVGYKKPPKEHQYKPGESGNLSGRPTKGSTTVMTLDDLLKMPLRIANQKITVTKGGEPIEMAKVEAIMEQLFQKGLSGDKGAMKMLLTLLEKALKRYEEGQLLREELRLRLLAAQSDEFSKMRKDRKAINLNRLIFIEEALNELDRLDNQD